MRLPQLLRRNVFHQVPNAWIRISLPPIGLQVLIVELRKIAIEPRQQMHAVGYRGDWNFPHRQLGPQLLPHFLRHLAVQAAHGVAECRGLDGRDRHREWFVVILGPEPA